MSDKPIKYEVVPWPPKDDPGWYEVDVWDCSACGVQKIDAECVLCPGCLAERPEGSVYRGRCWGMRIENDPEIKLTDLHIKQDWTGFNGDQSIKNVKDDFDTDAAFLEALRNVGSLK